MSMERNLALAEFPDLVEYRSGFKPLNRYIQWERKGIYYR